MVAQWQWQWMGWWQTAGREEKSVLSLAHHSISFSIIWWYAEVCERNCTDMIWSDLQMSCVFVQCHNGKETRRSALCILHSVRLWCLTKDITNTAKCIMCFALYFTEKKLGGARDRQGECQWCAAVVPPTAVRSAWRLSDPPKDWLSSSWATGIPYQPRKISESRVSMLSTANCAIWVLIVKFAKRSSSYLVF